MKMYGTKRILPVYGNSRPLERRINNKKIAGWKEQLFNATSVSQNDTYNDSAFLKIYGKNEQNGTPTPKSPITINSVSDFDLVSSGKNLLDRENIIIGGIAGGNGENWNVNTRIRTPYIPVKPSTSYSVTVPNGYVFVNSNAYDINKNWLGGTVKPTPVNTAFIRFCFKKPDTNAIITGDDLIALKTLNWQVEEGASATTYEPFRGIQTINFPYTLRSLPDGTNDYIEIDNVDKTAKLYTNIGTKTFVGTEAWVFAEMTGSLSRFFSVVVGNKTGTDNSLVNVMSDKFLGKSWNDKNTVQNVHTYKGDARIGLTIDNNLTGIVAEDDSATKANKVKAWMVNNNFTVQYQLATPVITDLDYEEVATYYPYTNIYTNATVQPMLDGKIRIIDKGE